MKTNQGRVTAAQDDDVVVFLIGMRVNRFWKVWQWMRTALAMPRMLRELSARPELGLLAAESWFGRTTILVSYWKSSRHLIEYAKMRDAEHLPAWRAFNKAIGTNGDVGVWHETYVVKKGAFESVYVNMPEFGLGRVAGTLPAMGKRATAEGRLGGEASAEGEGLSPHAAG